jgi:predicted ATPase/class 3 adenylate cyclase
VAAQPTGTVTLLFSDIEGSTALLERIGSSAYSDALTLHREILRSAFAAHDGYEVDTAGDAFFVAFGRASDALAAAADAQRGLASASWPAERPIRVRIGVHTGEPLAVPPGFVGPDVHRAARIMAAAHGGQVVVAGTTRALLDEATQHRLRDLGEHRLKDLLAPVPLYQLVIDGLPSEFPALRSLHRTNLPVAPWPLLGRESELDEIRRLIQAGTRLLTLTGPGGTGKTRLALQAAAELSDSYPHGVYFVPLAALRTVDGVRPAIAERIGLSADDDPAEWLRNRTSLLVLDNLEQLPDAGGVIVDLLVGGTVLLATSRSRVHLSAEHELPVAPLDEDSAAELFAARAEASGRRVDPDATVRAICRRLDNLPLAVELAAARSKLLAPRGLLERLDTALPILSGGPSDLPERQRTLRATIEWSHELLDEPGRTAFRRLSVFRGSFTLEAAEAIADADLDAIGGLVDQSLLTAREDGRFLVLETIREYARERLDEADETQAFALRHARHYLGELESWHVLVNTDRAGEVREWYRGEEENLGTMLDRLCGVAPAEATRAIYLLARLMTRWGASAEARRRVHALLEDRRLGDAERAMLYVRLAGMEDRLGNIGPATEAARVAAGLTEDGGDPLVHVDALGWLAVFASRRGDVDEAIVFARRALVEAEGINRGERVHALYDLGSTLGMAGRSEEARATLREAIDEAHVLGDRTSEMFASLNLAEVELNDGAFGAARDAFERTVELNQGMGDTGIAAWAGAGLGMSLIGLDRRPAARRVLLDALGTLLVTPDPLLIDIAPIIHAIALAAETADAVPAARLCGAAATLLGGGESETAAHVASHAGTFERRLIETLGSESWEREVESGRSLSLDQAVELSRALDHPR